jgi:hypothetical protein
MGGHRSRSDGLPDVEARCSNTWLEAGVGLEVARDGVLGAYGEGGRWLSSV